MLPVHSLFFQLCVKLIFFKKSEFLYVRTFRKTEILTNSFKGLRNIFMLTRNLLRTVISSLEQSGYYSFLSAHGLQTGYLIQIHPYL